MEAVEPTAHHRNLVMLQYKMLEPSTGKATMLKRPVLALAAILVLAVTASKEPLGPVVRQGDDRWFNVVNWVNFAMINAEELGVISKNVDEKAKFENPEIRRLLGFEGNFGEAMGLDPEWAYRIVKLVGNYGEIFDRKSR